MSASQFLGRRAALLLSLSTAAAVAACAGSGSTALSPADQTDVARVEAYLNGLSKFSVGFSQVWPDGGVGEGILTYSPGDLKLDYTYPPGLSMKAANGHLVLRDDRNGSVTHMGLSHNPLGLLLATPIGLSGPITVTSVLRGPEFLQVSLARTAMPSDGLLTLQFRDHGGSLVLQGLRLVDDRRRTTTFRIQG